MIRNQQHKCVLIISMVSRVMEGLFQGQINSQEIKKVYEVVRSVPS